MKVWVITDYEEIIGVTNSAKKVEMLKAACPKYDYTEYDTDATDEFLDGSTWWKYIANPHDRKEDAWNYGFEHPYSAFLAKYIQRKQDEQVFECVLKAKNNVEALEKGRAQFLQYAAENPDRWTESEVNFYR